MPVIEVPLKLSVNVASDEEAAQYLDPSTGEASIDFIADLFDG